MADYSGFTNSQSDAIELDMNIVICFTCDEYTVEFKSRRFR